MTTQLQLSIIDQEARVDSRLIAKHLGTHPKNTRQLIDQYRSDFEEFGQLPFETEVGKRPQGGGTPQEEVSPFETDKPLKENLGGRPQKFYLLNEDQAYLLLTYSQNTPKARTLKKAMVRAFNQSRRLALRPPKEIPRLETQQEAIAAWYEERRARLFTEQIVSTLERQLESRPIRRVSRIIPVETLQQGQRLNDAQREQREKSAEIDRQITELRQSGLTYVKIARLLGIHPGAIHSRVSRIRRQALEWERWERRG